MINLLSSQLFICPKVKINYQLFAPHWIYVILLFLPDICGLCGDLSLRLKVFQAILM